MQCTLETSPCKMRSPLRIQTFAMKRPDICHRDEGYQEARHWYFFATTQLLPVGRNSAQRKVQVIKYTNRLNIQIHQKARQPVPIGRNSATSAQRKVQFVTSIISSKPNLVKSFHPWNVCVLAILDNELKGKMVKLIGKLLLGPMTIL